MLSIFSILVVFRVFCYLIKFCDSIPGTPFPPALPSRGWGSL